MSNARILIVHPEQSALTLLASMLRSMGHEFDEAANDRVAVRLMERGGVALMLAGVDPSDADALELLSYMRRKHRQVPVLLLFSSRCPERAKEALRLGAMAVLRFPLPTTELRATVMQALIPRSGPAAAGATGATHLAPGRPTTQAAAAPAPPASGPNAGPAVAAPPPLERVVRELGIVGCDPSLRQAMELAATIAPTRTPVLIVGEPGTGKALLARMIHGLGAHGDQPLAVFNTSTIAEATTEHDRLGDHSNGRVDAEADWSSRLLQARGGTLFINEVSTLPDNLQTHLLQMLQKRELAPGGPSAASDVRFLMSSSDDLSSRVEQGRLREDLYYHTSVVCLKLSPLRHRAADIEALAEAFRGRFAHEFGKNIIGFTQGALKSLTKYDWPGNIRELEAVIRGGVILCEGTRINSGHMASTLSYSRPRRGAAARAQLPLEIRPLKEALEEPEKRIIIQALQALNGNRQETARLLDINRTTLYKKMKKYGLRVAEPIWVN
jgi:two-component system response regulator HydG